MTATTLVASPTSHSAPHIDPLPRPAGDQSYGLGFSIDSGYAITVASDGSALITGATGRGFPTTDGASDETLNGGSDAFVVRVDPTGRTVFATVLGGGQSDTGRAIAVDAAGAAYIGGNTSAHGDLPTTPGAISHDYSSPYDDIVGFLAKVSPDGSTLEWATRLPGVRYVRDVAVLSDGRIRISGEAFPDFKPSASAFDTERTGGDVESPAGEEFVATVAADGRSWSQRSFVGGSKDDYFQRMVVGPDDTTYLTGLTMSADLVTTDGAFDRSYDGRADVYVMRISADTEQVLWSTFLGGSSDYHWEESGDLALGPDGSVYVTGNSEAEDFPTTDGSVPGPSSEEAMASWWARLDPTGSTLLYSGYPRAYINTLLVDTDGDVGLVAYRQDEGDFRPVSLWLDTAGQLLKERPLHLDPYAADLDAAGTVYVLGYPLRDTVARAGSQAHLSRQARCTIRGTPGDDRLRGTSGPDVICAGAGDDVVRARGGYDLVKLGDGRDVAGTRGGIDVVFGGAGPDRVSGGSRRDLLVGGSGRDVLLGRDGFDELRGGPDDDTCLGGSGRTQLAGCES